MLFQSVTRWLAAFAFLMALSLVASLTSAEKAWQTDIDAWRSASPETVHAILALARSAFETYSIRREVIEPPDHLPELLTARAPVFVSAMRNGAPRCCMGTLYASEPDAAHEIVASAVAAAGRDRRFAPIKPTELRGLTLIVSVIGNLRPITATDATALDPTRDGLAVRCGEKYGVVLSCETTRNDRMIAWAKTRAGAKTGKNVEFFRFRDVRLVETAPERESGGQTAHVQ